MATAAITGGASGFGLALGEHRTGDRRRTAEQTAPAEAARSKPA
jgi:hypothetical protein